MQSNRKWLWTLAAIVFFGAVFAEKIINFYIDWLWFDTYGYESVLLTIITAKFGIGFLTGFLFFLVTFIPLKLAYKETSHLPVVLSDDVRREVPVLDLLATNLSPLILIAPLGLALATGLVGAQKWDMVLKYLNGVTFNQADPIFGKDYGFYVFVLPFWKFSKSVFWEALIVIAIGVGLISFFKRTVYVTPTGFVFMPEARRALSLIACFGFLLFAANFYFQRFEMLTEGNGVVNGISYSEDNGRLPALNICIVLALIGFLVSTFNIFKSDFRQIFIAAAAVGVFYIGGNLYPNLLQKFVVDPNELVKETPYIEHSIAATNFAFGLKKVETHELPGTSSLTAEIIEKNRTTIDNIRLWDEEPLLDTLGQIQEIRTYYQFAAVDNDRYNIDGVYRQTLLSPRELMSSSLPNRTWINEHLTFTHGYGVALSPVNQITKEGLPVLYIQDIPPKSTVDMKVDQPEIYFGELSNDHVFVNTGTKEFDYPEGEKNVYKNYKGQGGVLVGSILRKIALAARFKTMKILFSEDIQNESRVLMYRNIKDRVQQIAPFLILDFDPYLVISEGKLKWICDAYTVSDQFPYSQNTRGINYIRNSVKIVIDAYNGSMDFYIADLEDPVIRTFDAMFPKLFKDLNTMPPDLKAHIRYPVVLFALQTFINATYHMKTPQVFYNKEDQWEIPEIDNKEMQPYYTIMKLPGKEREEYILMLPFTPRGKSNLSAWMVARSDGEHLGKLDVYTFPKQRLVYGPNQIVARINQDAEVSRQISLWDQRGSNVIQGNLLVIPIEESLIYVRPLYLKADAGKIPELKRVIVGYEDQIAMEPTLDQALQKIFKGYAKSDGELEPDVADKILSESSDLQAGKDRRVVLRQSDFATIKKYFHRAVESQKQLDTSLKNYQSELQSLGKALNAVKTLDLPQEEPVGRSQ